MSQQEMTSGENAPVVVVEQTGSNLQNKPYRPTDMQHDANPELRNKRSRAPAVPPVTEDIKDALVAKDIDNSKDGVECDRGENHQHGSSHELINYTKNIICQSLSTALSPERQSHHAKKSLSKRRESSPENIPMELVDTQKDNITTMPQPIPDTDSIVSDRIVKDDKIDKEKKADEDSITEDHAEVRTTESVKDHSWSDDEEAGGLPRSESRGSWVTRAMRQLFCCGVAYNPPSEEELHRTTECSGI